MKFENDARAWHRGQFGGKYYCHDVRVIRCPLYGARSHRYWRILLSRSPNQSQNHKRGLFLEQLETDPAKYLPDLSDAKDDNVIVMT